MFERRWRLFRGRFVGMTGNSKLEFSTEGELLLLSKTEIGLLVWNWSKSFPFKETFWIGIVLPYVGLTVFGSCFLGKHIKATKKIKSTEDEYVYVS